MFVLVFMTYDHIITLGREIRCIWSWPLPMLSVAFLMSRYCSVVANVFEVYPYFTSSPLSLEVRHAFIAGNDSDVYIQRSSALVFIVKLAI
jgi:hypothetical protein